MKRCVVALLLVCLTQAYAAGQASPGPVVQTPTVFRGDPAPQPDPQTIANLKWFEVFKDEKLQALINDALTHNYDLRQAVARIDAARANYGITRSELFPTLGVSSDTINQRQSRSSTFDLPEPIKRDMTFHFVEHVEDVLAIALLEKNAAEQKTTDSAGRESHPLPEPEPASHEHVPVGQA